MKFFPDHWAGWQKGGVVLAVVVFLFWAFAQIDVEVEDGVSGGADAASKDSNIYHVVYLVRTSYTQRADVTYNNATEGMERRRDMNVSASKPARWEFNMPKGNHAYITVSASSTISQNVSTSCEVLIDGNRAEYTEAKGPLSSVTCSAIVGR